MTLLMYAVICIVAAAILYFVIKKAVKDAIIETKKRAKPVIATAGLHIEKPAL